MRKESWLAFLSVSILIGSGLFADDTTPKIDFDRGTDVEKTVEAIGQQARLLPISKMLLQSPELALKAPDFTITGRIIGVDLPARVQGSEPYKAALEYPPLIESLSFEVREPLKMEWNNINLVRGSLLSEANDLEREDRTLYAQGVELDRNAERLGRQAEQLEAEIDDFNRQCTGRPLPPDEYNACIRWRDDLIRRIDSHNAETRAHNNRVIQWRREVADLRSRAGTGKQKALGFLPRVVAWEHQRILPWIGAAKKALEEDNRPVLKVEVLNCKSEFFGSAPEFPGTCVNTCTVKQTNLITGEVRVSVEKYSEPVNSARECRDKPNTKVCFDRQGRKVPCPGEPGCLLRSPGEPCQAIRLSSD